MVVTLATRVIRFLKKRGYFAGETDSAMPEEETTQEELLPELQAAIRPVPHCPRRTARAVGAPPGSTRTRGFSAGTQGPALRRHPGLLPPCRRLLRALGARET